MAKKMTFDERMDINRDGPARHLLPTDVISEIGKLDGYVRDGFIRFEQRVNFDEFREWLNDTYGEWPEVEYPEHVDERYPEWIGVLIPSKWCGPAYTSPDGSEWSSLTTMNAHTEMQRIDREIGHMQRTLLRVAKAQIAADGSLKGWGEKLPLELLQHLTNDQQIELRNIAKAAHTKPSPAALKDKVLKDLSLCLDEGDDAGGQTHYAKGGKVFAKGSFIALVERARELAGE